MKNENKHSEMIDIMHTLHQYVPIISEESEGAPCRSAVHKVLFGGDQLTAARARGCRDLRLNSDTITGQLQGLLPVAEDWHTSVTLLSVSEHNATSCYPTLILYNIIIGYLETTLQYKFSSRLWIPLPASQFA